MFDTTYIHNISNLLKMTQNSPQNATEETIFARAIGRRKEAIAQVQLIKGNGELLINGKSAQEYLHENSCSILAIQAPFAALENLETSLTMDQVNIVVKVQGGGLIGQAEAIRLGVARALSQLTENSSLIIRKNLKDKGYLTQDSRIKERRKYGLKKARKASQYHKR